MENSARLRPVCQGLLLASLFGSSICFSGLSNRGSSRVVRGLARSLAASDPLRGTGALLFHRQQSPCHFADGYKDAKACEY